MKRMLYTVATLSAVLGMVQAARGADAGDLQRLKQTGECERCNLVGADLRNANLRDAKLKDSNLEAANLSGANLQNTNFKRANLRAVNFKNAIIQDTDFSEANLRDAMIDYRELERGDAKVCNAIMPNGIKKETNFEGFFGFGGCRN
ncbi:pentapeptide repeat-containing protein [Altericista sp. CCNU0014]|uniref:pentapeptide repeat-containing protein n=1 Tax=Altericista sp. CCNU0014 TaxID=3082949 RepID=UPI00384C60CA